MSSVLVFPINQEQAQRFAATARSLGFRVIAATSEVINAQQRAQGLVSLPYVTDPGFDAALQALQQQHGFARIYTFHAAVWKHVSKMLTSGLLPSQLQLCNNWPMNDNWAIFEPAYAWAQTCKEALPLVGDPLREALTPARYANLYHGFTQIPGESDAQKVWLLAQIFRHAAEGDIVEIGSAYGRSAYCLAWLSQQYRLGSVICVDPWNYGASADQGEQARIVNECVRDVNWEQVFQVFCAAVGQFEHVAYVRQPSAQAITAYEQAGARKALDCEQFGSIPVQGCVSVLHIDGNHAYESVKEDVELWLPHVRPKGWVLIDDYVWAFGDGPRRVGDALLDRIDTQNAFVVGDTLCLQIV